MNMNHEEYRKAAETLDAVLMPLMPYFTEDVRENLKNAMRIVRDQVDKPWYLSAFDEAFRQYKAEEERREMEEQTGRTEQ
jgi:cation transport regulator ChaB